MNKYVNYNLIAEDGEQNEHFESYRKAFSAYQRSEAPKTLYGYTLQGDVEVIFSK